MVTKKCIVSWRGEGRGYYTTEIPEGLKVKEAPKGPLEKETTYFLNDLSIFDRNSFEYHDAYYYGLRLSANQVQEEITPDLRPYNWNINNTQYSEWFERDRALVTLSDNRGNTIISLVDEQVSEFIEDGFKNNRQSWHEALCEYATERELRAQYE